MLEKRSIHTEDTQPTNIQNRVTNYSRSFLYNWSKAIIFDTHIACNFMILHKVGHMYFISGIIIQK